MLNVSTLATVLSKLLSDQHECEVLITFNKRGGDENVCDKPIPTSSGSIESN